MEQLQLKSRLISKCDYQDIDISQYAIPLKADTARYERDVKNFCKRFAKKEEVEEIAQQDMVTLSCSSENSKFQKEHITIRVGLDLYSKELEEKVCGMKVGETKTFTVGADSVTVTVEKSIREIIPELTDELVLSSGIPDIKTVEDVHTYCRYKQYDDALEEAADEANAYLAGEALNHSSYDLDESELETARKIVSDIMNLDTLKETLEDGGAKDAEQEISDMVEVMGKNTLMAAVFAQSMTRLTKEDYEAYLDKLAVALDRPVEEVRKTHPLTEYVINTYNDFFMDTMEAYVFRKLKEIGETMADKAV